MQQLGRNAKQCWLAKIATNNLSPLILAYPGLSRPIPAYPGLSWLILAYPGLSWLILAYPSLSCQDKPG